MMWVYDMLIIFRPSYSGQKRTDFLDRKNELGIFLPLQENHVTNSDAVKAVYLSVY